MFKVLQVSTGYTDGEVERQIIEGAGGSHRLISSENNADIIAAGQEADALIVALTKVDRQVITSLPKLKVIVRAGIGVDNIDLQAAKEKDVRVFNLPTYCHDEVADHAMTLLLALERRLIPQVLDMRKGEWNSAGTYAPIRGLRGAVLGFIGCGGIAQKMMERARAFGMQLIGFDPYLPPEVADRSGVTLMEFDDVLSKADYLSLHTPLTEETKHIFNDDAFSKMKDGVYIINTARGGLIDHDALYRAISDGKVLGAGLDVIDDGDTEQAVRFSIFENVLITPHTAYYSDIANWNIKSQAGQVIVDFFTDKLLQKPIV